MAQQALDRPGRGVAERADGMALDLIGHIEQRVDLVDPGIVAHQAGHHAPHPDGSLAAGRALTHALVPGDVREAADGGYAVGRLLLARRSTSCWERGG